MRQNSQQFQRPWRLLAFPDATDAALAKELDLPDWMAALLRARKLNDPKQIRAFLSDDLATLPDPFLLIDMEPAVERLLHAKQKGETIAIYGDYDADGVTATALLTRGLQRLGFEAPLTYIPDRFDEGYGLNIEALEYLFGEGAELIITVDCGITAHEEADYLRSEGVDLIITDHHQPGTTLPKALAVIDPQCRSGLYPCPNLAGVGVAHELMRALSIRLQRPDAMQELTALVAIGSLADLVELSGVNRVLVRDGLRALPLCKQPGLRALLSQAKLSGELSAQQVQFGLVPKINASGRMQHADLALELLMVEDQEEAEALAAELDGLNGLRKRTEQEVFQEAWEQYNEFEAAKRSQAVQIFFAPHWHPGVLGIVAAKLLEKLQCPVLVACAGEDGGAKGSGRAPEGYNLFGVLSEASDLLTRFGGHHAAVGFSCPSEHLDALQERLSLALKRTKSAFSELRADLELPSGGDWQSIYRALRRLEPCGVGNEEAVWLLRGALVQQVRLMGQGEHLTAQLSFGGSNIELVAWRQAASMTKFGGMVDLLARLVKNVFRGQESIRLELVAWRATEVDQLEAVQALRHLANAKTVHYSSHDSYNALLESGCVSIDQEIEAPGYSEGYPILPVNRHVTLGAGTGPEVLLDPLFEIIESDTATEVMRQDLVSALRRRAHQNLERWLLPDLADLRQCYRWLRDQDQRCFDELNFAEHPGRLKEDLARIAIANVLAVFTEAGLIEVSTDGMRRVHIITNPPQVKMELVPSFQKLQSAKKQVAR